MPDLFDQYAAQIPAGPAPASPAPASPAAPPAGDLFDHYAAQMPPASPSAYFAQHPTADPLAIEQAYGQLQGKAAIPQAETPEQFSQAVADQQGGMTHFGNAMGRTLARGTEGAIGLVNPQAAANLRQENNLQYGPQTGAGGFIGAQAGNLVNTPLMMSPLGRAISAAEAMGNKRTDIAQERAAGKDVSGAQEIARTAGTGALDYGTNVLMNKIGGKMFGGAGQTAAPAAKSILANYAKKFGADAAINEAVSHGQMAAQNVMDSRPVTEGMGKESLVTPLIQTAALGAVRGGGNAIEQMKARRAANAAPQTGEKAAEGSKAVPQTNAPQMNPEATEKAILAKQQAFVQARDANHPAADNLAAEIQQHLADYEQIHGEDKAEELVAKVQAMGEKPSGAAITPEGAKDNPAQNVKTEMPVVKPQEGNKYAQSDPRYMKAKQAIRSVSLPEGTIVHGSSMDTLAGAAENGLSNSELSGRVDAEKISKSGKATTAASYAGKGGRDLPILYKIKPGVEHAASDGGANAVEANSKGAAGIKPEDIQSVIMPDGRELPLAEAVKEAQTARTSEQVQTERPNAIQQMKGRLTGGKEAGAVAVPEAVNKLMERDIAPAVQKTKGNIAKSVEAIHRFFGTGQNLDTKGRDTAIALRESEAQHEVNQARAETALKPFRDHLEKMNDKERAQWVDQVEAGVESPVKELQPLAELNRQWNEKNKAEGAKYGLNTDKWDSDWIGRLATFPHGQEAGPGGKTRGSIAGSQKFRIKREYDTFSDFKNAVEEGGGKLKYDNPADMLLAKQVEVRRSIEARKLMYEQEKTGQLKWLPDSERPEGQQDTKLDDPLAKQTRDVVAPKWMVAKLLNLPHAEAEAYLKSPQWKKNSRLLRPGDEMPTGMARSGEHVQGTYHGDANVAGLFNNLISKGFEKDVPILSQLADLRRKVTALNLAVPTAHAALTTVSNAVSQFGLAMEAAAKGHWDLAAKNAWRGINPAAAARFGGQVREQAANPQAHPELEQTVQTSMKGGNKFDLKSVLNETAYQSAKKEWEAGNKAGAAARGIKAVYHAIETPLFDHYIPNIKAAAKGAAAEIAIRDGLSGKELSRKMALAQDNVDNLLGMVKRSHQFQNRILTDLQDVVFTAPKFAEGTFRFAGAVGRDTARALKAVAKGEAPKMTPAMYSAVAGVMTHMVGSALMQMVYTTATTGKAIWPSSLEDYYKPRTGRKDDVGRDERVSILSPFSALFSAGEHGVGSVTGRVGGLWKAAKSEITGVDERGRKLEGVSGRLGYAAKQALPYSVQNLMDLKQRGNLTADKAAGSALGMHYGHEGSTPAERAAWDVIHAHYQAQPRGQEEADKADLIQKLTHEQRVHDPNATRDLQQALHDSKISPKDASAIRRRANEKPGLEGLLNSTEIDAKNMMSQVWPKMTPEERKQFRLQVRAKIGRSGLPQAQKTELWKQTDQ